MVYRITLWGALTLVLLVVPGLAPLLAARVVVAAETATSSPLTAAVVGLPDSPEGLIGGSAVIVAPGFALSLQEAFAKPVAPGERRLVILPGGVRRMATVSRIDEPSTGVLLAFDTTGSIPVALADVTDLTIGSTVWTVGNSSGAIGDDGVPAISRGIVSGLYPLPVDGPPMRGRGGRILSRVAGPVFEIDAAVNDGGQGGAVLDANGRLIGLASLATARERRLGTALPLSRLMSLMTSLGRNATAADVAPPLQLPPAAAVRDLPPPPAGLALVAFNRLNGLGNPESTARPTKTVDQVPIYERERLERWWDRYHHDQQVLWTDSPSAALVIDPAQGLLLTAAANLHGGATSGRVLLPDGVEVPFVVRAVDIPLDLALLAATGPLPLPAVVIAATGPAAGDAVAVVARHRLDAPPTRTAGHVSCTQRRLDRADIGYLQIDARANYASLGGAVVDTAGRVIGIVVKSGPESHWLINSGVTLAIDGTTIASALPALLAGTTRQKLPTLGLGLRLKEDPESPGSVIIRAIIPGTGAAVSELMVGDALVSVDGRPATSPPALSRTLLRHRAGDTVPVEVRRNGKLVIVPVELREFNG